MKSQRSKRRQTSSATIKRSMRVDARVERARGREHSKLHSLGRRGRMLPWVNGSYVKLFQIQLS